MASSSFSISSSINTIVVRFIKTFTFFVSRSNRKLPTNFDLQQAHTARIIISFFMKRTTSKY